MPSSGPSVKREACRTAGEDDGSCSIVSSLPCVSMLAMCAAAEAAARAPLAPVESAAASSMVSVWWYTVRSRSLAAAPD